LRPQRLLLLLLLVMLLLLLLPAGPLQTPSVEQGWSLQLLLQPLLPGMRPLLGWVPVHELPHSLLPLPLLHCQGRAPAVAAVAAVAAAARGGLPYLLLLLGPPPPLLLEPAAAGSAAPAPARADALLSGSDARCRQLPPKTGQPAHAGRPAESVSSAVQQRRGQTHSEARVFTQQHCRPLTP
jgi:hypothetical protein